eukprot:1023734-Rhodomonas_salina.1
MTCPDPNHPDLPRQLGGSHCAPLLHHCLCYADHDICREQPAPFEFSSLSPIPSKFAGCCAENVFPCAKAMREVQLVAFLERQAKIQFMCIFGGQSSAHHVPKEGDGD